MRKPLLVRLVGVAGWIFALGAVGIVYQVEHGVHLNYPGGDLFVAVALTLGCWFIWAIISGLLWLMRKQGATTAAIVRDVVPGKPTDRWPAGEHNVLRLYCVTHKEWVAMGILSRHDMTDCLYVPDLPRRYAPTVTPTYSAPTMTSPLGLNTKR